MLIIQYVIAVALISVVFVLFMQFYSLRESRIGLFTVKGNVDTILNKLIPILTQSDANIKQIDVNKKQIQVYGIVLLMDSIIELNKKYGDIVVFKLTPIDEANTEIDVVGKRLWNSRCSYTRDEIIKNEYNEPKISGIIMRIL